MPYPRRRAALRDLLRAEHPELDALLVTDLVNVRYLTGFTGSNAALLVHADGDAVSRLGTDGRYRTQIGARGPRPAGADRAGQRPGPGGAAPGDCGRSASSPTPSPSTRTPPWRRRRPRSRSPAPRAWRPGCARSRTPPRSPRCGRPARAGDAALAELLAAGGLRPGRTEREVALDLENRMRVHGATGPAFATIVAAGPHSAVPHHQPTDVPLRRGDLVTLDFGALVEGYHSDMTRTVVLGPPADWQRELYALVAAAQAAGRAALVAGTGCADVDAAARSVIDAGRSGRRVRAPARPRCRPADPRGAAARRDHRLAWPPGWWSPSNRASTWRAAAECGSRTPCWSATATPQPLTRTTRDLLEVG